MSRRTFTELTAEGQKLSGTLDTIENLMSDPQTIKEQAVQLRRNGDAKSGRLRYLTAVLDKDCLDCGHPRTHHDRGMNHCGVGSVNGGVMVQCSCKQWAVEVEDA